MARLSERLAQLEALERRYGNNGPPPRVECVVIHGPGVDAEGYVTETLRWLDGSPGGTRRVPADEWDRRLDTRPHHVKGGATLCLVRTD